MFKGGMLNTDAKTFFNNGNKKEAGPTYSWVGFLFLGKRIYLSGSIDKVFISSNQSKNHCSSIQLLSIDAFLTNFIASTTSSLTF
jgi:hypothetical protein